MSQVEIALDRDALLVLRAAQLELECAELKARLLHHEADHLLALAQQVQSQTIALYLARTHPGLPPPQGPLTLDVVASYLRYETPGPTLPPPPEGQSP